jgi:hypothetical protein
VFILVHFVFICVTFSGFGIMHQEKSGNPGQPIIATNCRQSAVQYFVNGGAKHGHV